MREARQVVPGPRGLSRAHRRSVAEGALYAGMVGLGEFWLIADAVRLGATALQIAALVTVPQLVGAAGAWGMLSALRSASRRRPWVVGAVIGQAAVMVALGVATAVGRVSPLGLVVASCAYAAFGQAAGTGWSSWMADLVPRALHGRWFGSRTRFVSVAMFAGIVIGGGVLQLLEPAAAGEANAAGGGGYALLYLAAGSLRLGCAWLLVGSWEPPFARPEAIDHPLTAVQAPAGRGVVLVGAAMMVAVCVSTPFFAPHMLETLKFSYLTYLGAQAVMVAAKVLALGPWGRLVDRFGPVPVYGASSLLVALVPIPWMFADQAWVVFLAQGWSGLAWGGNEVALLALTFAAAGSRQRAVLLTAQSVTNGVAQVGGGLIGTWLAPMHPGHSLMFGVSAAGRAVVAILSPALLAPLTRVGPTPWWDVGARVVGWRPNGGLVRQLILPSRPPPPPSPPAVG